MRCLACLFLCVTAFAADSDLIFHNGRVVTLDCASSFAEAVAVKDGRIVAVGTSAAVLKAERGPATKVVDLKGRMVLPGIYDSHVHALGAGLSEYRKPLPPLDSFAAVQSFIREQARTTPKGKWIIVPRTFPTRLKEMRMPTREVLDVTTDHPVMFDASYVWVANSYALKMSGITRETKDPPRGVIVRDAKGEPNGILRNAGSLLKGMNRAENFTEAERLNALEGMLKRYVAAGLTTIGDRAVTPADIDLYRKLKASGRLPLRVVLTWRIESTPPIEQIRKTIADAPFTTGTGDDWLKLNTFKVTLDGGMTIGTAYQRYPYGEFGKQLYGLTKPDERGQLFIAPEKLAGILRAARDRGWQLTSHSQGGGAIDAMLTALEILDREKPIAPTRSHLMHASFQSPEAIARTRKLGIAADVQPAWLYLDAPALEKVFGRQGLRDFFPLKSYLDAGVPIIGGSDHMIGYDKNRAVNPYNPFLGMWTAVTRKMHNGDVLYPNQRITREQALRMYTSTAAWLEFAESRKGTIEKGKLADLVLIDRDYFKCPEDQIKDIEPLMTVVAGKVAYEKR